MADRIGFEWQLSGSGWASCRISDGATEAKFAGSYCTDALADLLGGLAGRYRPEPVERISFDLEPAEIRWVLRGDGTDVDISIRQFPDIYRSYDRPDTDGALTWHSVQPRSGLVHAVVEAARAVLREHGEAGYKARWARFEFPVAALRRLRQQHLLHDECDRPHEPSER
ncbi:hypothetical protein [Kitasatospora sp. NPDC004531]